MGFPPVSLPQRQDGQGMKPRMNRRKREWIVLYEHLTLTASDGTPVALDTYCPDVKEGDDKNALRTGIVICGGGGYSFVSDRETEPVALRFAAMGFNTFVVRYRVAPFRFPCAVQDIAAAVACVRRNAARYQQHPGRIAVMGFSAGGHAACSLGVMWPREELWSPISCTPADVKPNAMILCYPVITGGPHAHRNSFRKLTGSEELAVHQRYSLETMVSEQTPPAFLWATWDDSCVPCQNTLCFASALREHGIPAEVHIYPHGAHGLSLADKTTWCSNPILLEPAVAEWPELAARFLNGLFGE